IVLATEREASRTHIYGSDGDRAPPREDRLESATEVVGQAGVAAARGSVGAAHALVGEVTRDEPRPAAHALLETRAGAPGRACLADPRRITVNQGDRARRALLHLFQWNTQKRARKRSAPGSSIKLASRPAGFDLRDARSTMTSAPPAAKSAAPAIVVIVPPV